MIDYKEIEEKVKSMSAHDIIMSMVNGLRAPRTEIDMGTFGAISEGICFGCAATNAILHIIDASDDEIRSHVTYTSTHVDYPLWRFECAINLLRRGSLGVYNAYVKDLSIAHITPIPGQELPILNNDYTEEQLKEYEKLAKHQLTI